MSRETSPHHYIIQYILFFLPRRGFEASVASKTVILSSVFVVDFCFWLSAKSFWNIVKKFLIFRYSRAIVTPGFAPICSVWMFSLFMVQMVDL